MPDTNDTFDKIVVALAFFDVGLKALERAQWLMSREGAEFSDEEKAKINRQLADARQNFQAELAKLTA